VLVATSAMIEDYGGGGCGSLTPFEMEADTQKGGVDHIQGDRGGRYRATSTTSVA